MKEVTPMQEKLFALNTLTSEELEQFYTISFSKWAVRLQGDYKPATLLYWKNRGFEFTPDSNGYLTAEKDCFSITLTP